jgi:hypothetical protein
MLDQLAEVLTTKESNDWLSLSILPTGIIICDLIRPPSANTVEAVYFPLIKKDWDSLRLRKPNEP